MNSGLRERSDANLTLRPAGEVEPDSSGLKGRLGNVNVLLPIQTYTGRSDGIKRLQQKCSLTWKADTNNNNNNIFIIIIIIIISIITN